MECQFPLGTSRFWNSTIYGHNQANLALVIEALFSLAGFLRCSNEPMKRNTCELMIAQVFLPKSTGSHFARQDSEWPFESFVQIGSVFEDRRGSPSLSSEETSRSQWSMVMFDSGAAIVKAASVSCRRPSRRQPPRCSLALQFYLQ